MKKYLLALAGSAALAFPLLASETLEEEISREENFSPSSPSSLSTSGGTGEMSQTEVFARKVLSNNFIEAVVDKAEKGSSQGADPLIGWSAFLDEGSKHMKVHNTLKKFLSIQGDINHENATLVGDDFIEVKYSTFKDYVNQYSVFIEDKTRIIEKFVNDFIGKKSTYKEPKSKNGWPSVE